MYCFPKLTRSLPWRSVIGGNVEPMPEDWGCGPRLWKCNTILRPWAVSELPGIMPAVRVVPCTEIPCQRCEQLAGGFRFPCVGRFSSASAVVPEGYSVAKAWPHYYEHRAEALVEAEVNLLWIGLYSSNFPRADTVLDKLAEERARKFRDAYFLQKDRDFADAFASWEEAVTAGGAAVADAWMETVADIDDPILLRAVDEAHAAAATVRREERPPIVRLLKPTKLL